MASTVLHSVAKKAVSEMIETPSQDNKDKDKDKNKDKGKTQPLPSTYAYVYPDASNACPCSSIPLIISGASIVSTGTVPIVPIAAASLQPQHFLQLNNRVLITPQLRQYLI